MYKVKYKDREYRSMTLACDLLGVSVATVNQYVKRGMSIEQSIEQILKNKKCSNSIDHLGNTFESKKAMAEFYNIPYKALCTRLKRKWSLKRALTTPIHNCIDHLGNTFESKKAMAEFYNIPYLLLNRRLEREWSLKRALTTPVGKPRGKSTNG